MLRRARAELVRDPNSPYLHSPVELLPCLDKVLDPHQLCTEDEVSIAAYSLARLANDAEHALVVYMCMRVCMAAGLDPRPL